MHRSVPPQWAKVHCHVPHTTYGLGWYNAVSWRARLVMSAWHFSRDSKDESRFAIEWAIDKAGLVTG